MARKPRQASVKKSTEEIAIEVVEETRDTSAVQMASNVSDEIIEAAVPLHSLCGGALKQAREDQQLTLDNVANQLRLSIRQVEALEADNFSELPEVTIIKGFIRNYAKLLKIPAEPLVAAFIQIVPETQKPALTLTPASSLKLTSHKKKNKKLYVLAVLAITIGLATWFFYHTYIEKPNPVLPTSELSGMPPLLPQVDLPEVALPAAERLTNNYGESVELPTDPSSENQEVTLRMDTLSEPKIDNVMIAQSEEALVIKEEVAVEQQATDITPIVDEPLAQDKSRIEIEATQETWVSIVDASGREVYNRTLFAGNNESVDIRSPMKIIFGNAHGAILKVNGSVLDLAPYTRINVARVSVN